MILEAAAAVCFAFTDWLFYKPMGIEYRWVIDSMMNGKMGKENTCTEQF